jgi:hypothetical protein
MKHKHHIIPRHMGGTDSPENLIELSVEEHAQSHLKLYEEYGKIEDLCAYYMLSGKNKDPEFIKMQKQIAGKGSQRARIKRGLTGAELFYGGPVSNEEIIKNSSKGGKIQGKRNAETGHMQRIQKLSDPVSAGKKGGATTMARGKGAFADPIERLKSCSKGGKVAGKKNAESGHLKRLSQMSIEENKRSKGKIWINNGKTNLMIEKNQNIPEGFQKGKLQKKYTKKRVV